MPGFFDIKSEKWPVWGLFASVAVVFVGFFLVLNDLESSKTTTRQPALKCENPDCTYTEKLTREERKLRAKADYETLRAENPEKADQYLDDTYQLEMEFEQSPGMEDLITEEYVLSSLLMSWGNSGPAFRCPTCGKDSVWDAIACPNPKGCDNVFFRGEYDTLYGDKCPKCEFSRREDQQQKERDDKKRQLQIKKDLREERRQK